MDLVISFDDTGSMSSVRNQVRSEVTSLCTQLFDLIPDLNIGIIIHNDYCDKDILVKLPLTSDKKSIVSFVNCTTSGYGGDADECYELVLHELHNFNWRDGVPRAAIMIGDCNPHKPGYKLPTMSSPVSYDWQIEASLCAKLGVKIYTIKALNYPSEHFYSKVASLTNAVMLRLTQFSHIIQYILAVAYQSVDKLEQYEDSDPSFKANLALSNMFNSLRGKSSLVSEEVFDLMGRFQVLDVVNEQSIKYFVESNGLTFKTGRGFYEFTKRERITDKKEIILVDKTTGETIANQAEARSILGLPLYGETKLSPNETSAFYKYKIYVQSTSYNRKLVKGTKFLYEVDHK